VFLYYVATPWNFIGRTDPVGGEAGYEQIANRSIRARFEEAEYFVASRARIIREARKDVARLSALTGVV
jgi:hypothetical protein